MKQPLLPDNIDLRDFQFMPLDVVRLRDSDFTAVSSGEAFRAGIILWSIAWHQVPAGSLPADDQIIASLAGYGRSPKEWQKIRAQAMHGWVECSDGRLYHPVICEKAMEAWQGKQEHQYTRFADRMRKSNKKLEESGGEAVEIPAIETWIMAGCPKDWRRNSQNIPSEQPQNSAGNPEERHQNAAGIPSNSELKGQGQGQGQGQGYINNNLSLSEAAPKKSEKPEVEILVDDWQPELGLINTAGTLLGYQPATTEKFELVLRKFKLHNLGLIKPEQTLILSLANWLHTERDQQPRAKQGSGQTHHQSDPPRQTKTPKAKERTFESFHDSEIYAQNFTAGELRKHMRGDESPEACILRLVRERFQENQP